MENINYKSLKNYLLNYFEAAFFIGGYGASLREIERIKYANKEELIELANQNNIDLNNFIAKQKIKRRG